MKQCIACDLIDGKAMVADRSYIPANVSRESWVDVETEVEQSMQSYLDSLDEELSQQPGSKKPSARTIKSAVPPAGQILTAATSTMATSAALVI